MTEKQYSKFVAGLLKSGHEIWHDMTPSDVNLIHIILGLADETGELVSATKKAVIYRQELDKTNLLEEMGDLEYYLSSLRAALGVTRAQVIAANVKKLRKRYKNGYSDAAAFFRADKIKK